MVKRIQKDNSKGGINIALTVGIIDSFLRIRDLKVAFSLKEVYKNKISFVLIKNTPRTDNEKLVPGLKVRRINSKKNAVEQVIEICRKHKIDVLHTHNYPDTYGFWGLKVRDKLKIPVVHECHDIGYHNTSASNKQLTDIVMKGVDKIISVSNSMTVYLQKHYGVKKKCITVYAFPNKKFLPKISNNVPKAYMRGVYQGGINIALIPGSPYNHRYYKGIFAKLTAQGLSMDVYPARPMNRGYDLKKVKFRNSIPSIKELYRTISTYDFGFIGYHPTKSTVMDLAVPNKLWEYIACGLPVITMDYITLRQFVKNNGLGVVVNKHSCKIPPNYHSLMANGRRKAIKIAKSGQFTMERQARMIYKMYEGMLE